MSDPFSAIMITGALVFPKNTNLIGRVIVITYMLKLHDEDKDNDDRDYNENIRGASGI